MTLAAPKQVEMGKQRASADGPLHRENVTNALFEGDCLALLERFPSHCVDLILCDLPYGTTQNPWDSPISLTDLWAAYRRVLKPSGTIVLTAQGLFTARLMVSNEKWFR